MNRRKQIIYGSIIGAVLIGLIIDRAVRGGGGPATVNAATPVGNPEISDRSAVAMVDDRISILPAPFPIAPDGAAADDSRNPFRMMNAVLATLQPSSSAALIANQTGRLSNARSQFESDHELEAVIVNGQHASALIDGILMAPGHVYDGCTIVEIQPRSVHFSCTDGDGELRLDSLLDGESPLPQVSPSPEKSPASGTSPSMDG